MYNTHHAKTSTQSKCNDLCFVTLILKLYDGILEKLVFTQPSRKLCVNHHRSGFCRTIQDPASQRLTWYKPPLSVLVIKKVRDASVIPPFISLVKWFIGERNMVGVGARVCHDYE